MKLVPKKNGKGYATSFSITFGSKEAKDLNLLDKNGDVKNIKSAESIDNDTIVIKLEKK